MASPPLSAAGGSGGELSSGSEAAATGAAAPSRDLPALFEQAAERLPSLLSTASKEQLLYLYARYKQVKLGTCNTPKPSFFDFEGKQKWEAWKALGDTSPHQAMQEYIAAVKKLDPSWNPQTTEKRGKESKTVFGGPVISSLYQEEEIIREEDKNIFDYCRENNIDYVTKAIQSKKVDVNVTDEEGRALLHWACDRGHKELVSVLLQNAADVNIQGDGEIDVDVLTVVSKDHWLHLDIFPPPQIFGFKCNLGIVNGSICVFLDCTFPGIDSEVILRSFTWCSGAPFSPSGLNCCSPDVPGNELLSFTQTHSSGPAEIALQEFEAQGQVPQLEGTDILQDGEGQTALHYAATCEFLDIVELLLQSGADPRLRDQEGCLPEEVTDSKAITSALQQHSTGEP
ncbi:hypothetical protein TURU_050982 [Turdus rufiventris]|nr:hypothetical protein TURU_050982 [Turdus rufiventris]